MKIKRFLTKIQSKRSNKSNIMFLIKYETLELAEKSFLPSFHIYIKIMIQNFSNNKRKLVFTTNKQTLIQNDKPILLTYQSEIKKMSIALIKNK